MPSARYLKHLASLKPVAEPKPKKKRAPRPYVKAAPKPDPEPLDFTRERQTNRVREVYFVRAVTIGLIKIGVANFALTRITSLQTHSPDKLEVLGVIVCGNYGALEWTLHQRFAHLRSHGEWFQPGDDLMAFIAENARDWRGAAADRREMEDRLPVKDEFERKEAMRQLKSAGNWEMAALFRKPRRGDKRTAGPDRRFKNAEA